MKKKRFYNNKKRNSKWTEKETGRKISFADKYIDAGNGSDKFDFKRPKPKKKRAAKEKTAKLFKNIAIVIACFLIISVGTAQWTFTLTVTPCLKPRKTQAKV